MPYILNMKTKYIIWHVKPLWYGREVCCVSDPIVTFYYFTLDYKNILSSDADDSCKRSADYTCWYAYCVVGALNVHGNYFVIGVNPGLHI